MTREETMQRLRAHRAELKGLGAVRLFLFGSTARDEAGAESDVDLFFDYEDPLFSLLDLVGVKMRVEEILGIDADVMTRSSLHPVLKDEIIASAVQVY